MERRDTEAQSLFFLEAVSENASKTHPKSSHDKFKTASNWQDADIHFFRIARVHPVLFHGFSSKMALDSICNCL